MFGAFVRARRKAVGISAAELASTIGVSEAFLSAIETGTKLPTEQRAKQLASALSIDHDELLAKCDMISSDLVDIILRNPIEMATLCRSAGSSNAPAPYLKVLLHKEPDINPHGLGAKPVLAFGQKQKGSDPVEKRRPLKTWPDQCGRKAPDRRDNPVGGSI